MKWEPERVSKGFAELFENGFANYCESTEFVFIPGYVKWNPISNVNVAKAREKEFDGVPSSFQFIQQLADELKRYGNHWGKGFERVIERVYQTRTNPNQPKPEPIKPLSGKPDADDSRSLQSVPDSKPQTPSPSPEQQAIEHLNKKTGRKYHLTEANLKLARARMREGFTLDDLKAVVDRKVGDWAGTKMDEYLRPATLFNAEKFNQYIAQARDPTARNHAQELEDWLNEGQEDFIEGEWEAANG
jgi:uncharacterized phage protein (TIGR02220 family)